jgi:hypothetical protein
VLVLLTAMGRSEAAAPLRRYLAQGRHWPQVLDAMWEGGVPELQMGLEELVLARVDDQELLEVVDLDWGPWQAWRLTQPRVETAAGILEQQRHRPSLRRVEVGDLTRAELLVFAQDSSRRDMGRPALIELGRRGDLAVLDLAEDTQLRTSHGVLPGLTPALGKLGSAALDRARFWYTSNDGLLAGLALEILAEHGEHRDIPTLLHEAELAATGGDACAIEAPARGLGRLKASQAAAVLMAAWEQSIHSYARTAILIGILGAARDAAEAYVMEGLDDCEMNVRALSWQRAPAHDGSLEHLQRLHIDTHEHPDVLAAAERRLAHRDQ